MGYWRGSLSGVWCKWFAYGPADATAIPSSLASVRSWMVYLSGVGLPRLSWKKAVIRMCVCVCVYVCMCLWVSEMCCLCKLSEYFLQSAANHMCNLWSFLDFRKQKYEMKWCGVKWWRVNVVGSVALAEEHRDFVLGFVCQSRVTNDQSFIHFTPGMSVSPRMKYVLDC